VPRRRVVRAVVRQLHLWVGLASGLVLAVVGATGSLYVFQPELSRLLSADVLETRGEAPLFETDQALARYVEAETGGRVESLQWPQRERATYQFKLFGDETWYYLDQTTGAITDGGEGYGDPFFAFVLDLHTTLTMGEVGRWITAVASLLLALVLISSGIFLWWPRKRAQLRRSLTIQRGLSNKRLNYDLHNVGGFWFSLPLFLAAVTGAAFLFYDEVQWVVDTVTFSEPAPPSIWEDRASTVTEGAVPLTIIEALDVMDRHYTSLHRRNLWLTDDPEGTLSLAYQARNTVSAGPDSRIFLSVDRYTGRVLRDSNPETLPRGARIMEEWMLPVHFGEFGGWPTRILWALAGLMPAVLLVTGVIMWWRPRWWPRRGTAPSPPRPVAVRPARRPSRSPASPPTSATPAA
jgi:uncharacterized iron-regulated membrane protein